MTFRQQPTGQLHRAKAMTTNYLDGMQREVIRLRKDKQEKAARHIEAVMNATKNAADIRLTDSPA